MFNQIQDMLFPTYGVSFENMPFNNILITVYERDNKEKTYTQTIPLNYTDTQIINVIEYTKKALANL